MQTNFRLSKIKNIRNDLKISDVTLKLIHIDIFHAQICFQCSKQYFNFRKIHAALIYNISDNTQSSM